MLLNEIKPSPFLAAFIRLYRIIDFNFPNGTTIPPKLYSPRPEQCLQFYVKDTETVSYPDSGSVISDSREVCVGQHSVIQQRQIGSDFLSVQVVFQPGGLYMLTGIPMPEIANQYLTASHIFGTAVQEVTSRLYHASSYEAMIHIVEDFLGKQIKGLKKQSHRVDACGKLMLMQEDDFRLDKFLNDACLSPRQFDRKFGERIGIPPKQFLRIIRFDKAYRMKNKFPHLDWLSIAVRCGYHDYQHMAKDYLEFTGFTPVKFFQIDVGAPERIFGEAET